MTAVLMPEEIKYGFRYCRCKNPKYIGYNGWMCINCKHPVWKGDRTI